MKFGIQSLREASSSIRENEHKNARAKQKRDEREQFQYNL